MRRFVWLGLVFVFSLPAAAPAGVTDATPGEVGYPGQVFEAGSACNAVMHIPLACDAQGDTLLAIKVGNNYFEDLPADEPLDIAVNSVRLWYVAVDAAGFSTAAAQFVSVLSYFDWRGYPSWEASGLSQWVGDGGALYVTVDIVQAPTPEVVCRFQTETSDIQFASGYWPGETLPIDPPKLTVVPNIRAQTLVVSAASTGQLVLSTGQDFDPLRLDLVNPGVPLTAPVFVTGLTLTVRDAGGGVLAPDAVLDRLGVRDLDGIAPDSLVTGLPGTPQPVYIPLGVSVTVFESVHRLQVVATLAGDTLAGVANFRLEWTAAANLAAWDALVGAPVQVAPAGGAFPFQSELFTLQAAAAEVRASHTPRLADGAVVYKGQTDVNPFNLTFRNPGTTGTARVDVTRLTLAVTDAAGATLSPASVLSRVAVGGDVFHGQTLSIPASGSLVTVTLTSSFVAVPAYQPVTATVLVDIRPDATATDFRLAVAGPGAVHAQDSNSLLPVAVRQDYDSDPFPMYSPTLLLAGSLIASGTSAAPQTLYAGQRSALLSLSFTHPGPADLGTLLLQGLTLTARDRSGGVLPWSGNVEALYVLDAGDANLAQAACAGAASELFVPLPAVPVAPLATVRLRLEARLAEAPATQSLSIGLAGREQVAVLQQSEPGRAVYVVGAWPLLSVPATVGGGEGPLRLSNFPNPFSPRDGPTRIAYFLDGPATVTARLYTLAGDQVGLLCQGRLQNAGENTLTWDGRTASGATVVNGVYLLRIEAAMIGSGATHVQLRKIAVVK